MEIIGVSEGVLKYLRVHIITRVIAPLQKLNEQELSSSLGISRAPLREAFRILAHENLVVSIPRKGCCVTGLSMKDCLEIFQARCMMEAFAIDLVESHGIRELPEVEKALENTAHLENPKDNDAYAKYDYLRSIADVHIKFVETAGNQRLIQLYNSIFSSLARYQSLYTYIPGLMDQSRKEHELFLRLIKKGNYSKAKEILISHINKFTPLIEDKVRALENASTNRLCAA